MLSVTAALLVLYLVAHIPSFGQGFGPPDAWRVALAAREIHDTGQYVMSRPPGHPPLEAIAALTAPIGPVGIDLLTLMASCAAILLFVLVAFTSKVQQPLLIAVGFAFFPLFWAISATALDYAWSLAFLLAAYLALERRSAAIAGLLLGVAGGFRLPTAVAVIPLLAMLWYDRRELKQIARFLAPWITTTVILMGPVLIHYSLLDLLPAPQRNPFPAWVYLAVANAFGIPATLLLGVAIFWLIKRGRWPAGLMSRDAMGWLGMVLIFVATYPIMPSQPVYLLPAAPFALLLLDRLLNRWVLLTFVALVALNGWIAVASLDPIAYRDTQSLRFRLFAPGTVSADLHDERSHVATAKALIGQLLPARSIVLIGSVEPYFQYLASPGSVIDEQAGGLDVLDRAGQSSYYAHSLSATQLAGALAERYHVFYLDGLPYLTQVKWGYDLTAANVVHLGLPGG